MGTRVHKGIRSRGGFSLVEVAMVMVISSLMLVAGVKLYDLYNASGKRADTLKAMEKIDTAISDFYNGFGRYPCPADPTLRSTDANAGVENCALATFPGARKTLAPQVGAMDPVYMGSVPFKTLQASASGAIKNVTVSDSLDPYGYKFGYAVSKTLTVKASFDNAWGSIGVQTENGQDLANPAASTHYVIIGYGQNHAGAYSADGKIPVPCAAGGTSEVKNCNLNGTFIQGIRAQVPYFDDYVRHTERSLTRLWDFIANPSDPNTPDVHNVNGGSVGVGVDIPQAKLDVAGTLAGTQIAQPSVCDDTGSGNCWNPSSIADPAAGNICSQTLTPPGYRNVVIGLQKAKVICGLVPLPAPAGVQSCPAGKYAVGFNSAGVIQCALP